MIIQCTCEHKDQDTLHGSKRRVANPTAKTTQDKKVLVCTVCGKQHTK